ncbi:MAG: hypothetical protein PGMFKBFP_02552 [Anaerolineales bacterium]|nr:hypothetical protein [Anaerolineales bacterium]
MEGLRPAIDRPPKSDDERDHEGIGLEGTTGDDGVRKQQIERGREKRAVFREEVAGEEIDEDPAEEPEEAGINPRYPEFFAGEFPGEDCQPFEDLRFDGGAQASLLDGEGALVGGRVGESLVVHAARFERGEELPRGMEVEGQVGQVVETDGRGRDEEDDEDEGMIAAKEGARGFGHGDGAYFN